MNVKSGSLLKLTFLYIYIPIFIFLFGWTKSWIAFITTIVLLTGGYFALKEYIGYDREEENVVIKIPALLLVTAVIAGLCIVVGIGGVFPQAGDWYKHNAILRDLIKMDWPVYYDVYDDAMLTYYLGHYLLPALIGKLAASFDAGNCIFVIWSVFGLLLVYLNLIRYVKANALKKQLLVLMFLLFFCGALNPCQNILKSIYEDEMNSLGSYHWVLVRNIMLQYRSNLVMIRWVIPQIIVPWITVILLAEHYKKVKFYMLLILPSMLYGTFSFVALALMGIIVAVVELLKHDITIRDIFSLSNLLTAASLGTVLFFYFLGFAQVKKPISSSFKFENYDGLYILIYVVFCICMFGIYALCVLPENRKNVFWYINVAILLFLPLCKMGLCNDIVMSASIPSLFFLMIFVLQLIFDERNNTRLGIRKGIVITVFVIGLWYPVKEVKDNIVSNTAGMNMGDDYKTLKWYTNRKATTISEDLIYNYYTYDLKGKIFYEYIAARKMP